MTREDKSQKTLAELDAELNEDLRELFETLSDFELADAVVLRINQYAQKSIDAGFKRGLPQDVVQEMLSGVISSFISDKDRIFVVCCHAQGISTADAVWDLIERNRTMSRLAQRDALGAKRLQQILVHRLSYLKPGTARWPERKYGKVWQEVRERHKQVIRDMPLTSTVEQSALLSKYVMRIDSLIENNMEMIERSIITARDFPTLLNSLTKTLESLRKLTPIEEKVSADLSTPQPLLLTVLERLTLMIKAPEDSALSGDKDELVNALEQVVVALKDSENPKALAQIEEEK